MNRPFTIQRGTSEYARRGPLQTRVLCTHQFELRIYRDIARLIRRMQAEQQAIMLVALDPGPAMSSLERPWTEDQKATVQGLVNEVYDRFVGHVAASRQLTRDAVLKIAGGRVWSGQQAVENKLVDRLGGLHDALAMVAKEAGVAPGFEVTHLPSPKDPIQALVEQLMEVRVMLPDTARAVLAQRSRSLDRGLQVLMDALRSKRPVHIWAMLPEALELR